MLGLQWEQVCEQTEWKEERKKEKKAEPAVESFMGVLSFLEPVWLKVLPSEKVHPLILSRVTFHRFLTKNKPHPLTSPETPH